MHPWILFPGSTRQGSSRAELLMRVVEIDNTTKHQGSTGDGLTLDATRGVATTSEAIPDSLNTSFSGSSFHCLPTELLFDIFAATMELVGVDWSLQHIRQLASVCKAWRDIVVSSPQLWTRIDSPDMIDTQLRLSKVSPLDITVTSTTFGKPENVLPLLSHSERWRSLAILDKSSSMYGVEAALGKPLPCLEKLELYNVKPLPQGTSIALGETPRLRELEVQAVCIKPSSRHQFSSLKSLTIHSGGISMNASSRPDLFALLSACPVLEYLALGSLVSAEGDTGPPSSPILPNLNRLILDNVPHDTVDVLLQHASTGNLTYFMYHTGTISESVHRHLPNTVLPILARNTDREVVIEVDHHEVSLKLEDCINIKIANSYFREFAYPGSMDTRTVFDLDPIRKLSLGLQLYGVKVTLKIRGLHCPPAFAPLSSLPPQILNIRTVHFTLEWNLEEILQIISMVDVQKRLLPFPALERIVIETGRPTNSGFQPYVNVIKTFIRTRNQSVANFPDIKSPKIIVEWNRTMVFDEQVGDFVLLKH